VSIREHVESEESLVIPFWRDDSPPEFPDVDQREPLSI